MVRLVLGEAHLFKKCVDAISVLIDEAEFQLSEEGLFLKATDPSQISMIDFSLPKSAFKEYNVETSSKIGMDLSYLSQVMGRSKSKDELVIELDSENSRLNLVFKGSSTRRFSVPLIDISGSEVPNPKIDFDAIAELKAGILQDALKDAALISTHLTVGMNSDSFFIKANSSKGELNNESKKGEVNLDVKEECQAMYPLDYLSDMLKAASSDNDIKLHLKANAPVKISYPIGQASVTYFLAPRIEN